eukprot:Selendium_serpulae@DN3526_c0_g1_i1.p2
MNILEETDVMGRLFFSGTLHGTSVVLVRSGIGKANAAIAATILVAKFNVSGIIVTGVAGGLHDELKNGDVIISNTSCEHDFGIKTAEGFAMGLPFYPGYAYAPLVSPPDLYDVARRVIPTLALESFHFGGKETTPTVRTGVIASGDIFVACSETRDRIRKSTGADVVEMEGAAVLKATNPSKTPVVMVRTVSDDGTSSCEFISSFDTVARNSDHVVEAILKQFNE